MRDSAQPSLKRVGWRIKFHVLRRGVTKNLWTMLKGAPFNISWIEDWLIWILLGPSYFNAIISWISLEGRLILLGHTVIIKRFLFPVSETCKDDHPNKDWRRDYQEDNLWAFREAAILRVQSLRRQVNLTFLHINRLIRLIKVVQWKYAWISPRTR